MARSRRFKRFGPVGRFAVQGLGVLLVVSVALAWTVSWRVNRAIVDESARSVALTANSIILHHLEGRTLAEPLEGAALESFDELVRTDLLVSDIFAVKLWSPHGRLVYSSEPDDPLGVVFGNDDFLEDALAGETVAEIAFESEAENRAQFASEGPLLEVYAPLRGPGSDAPLGVFETYQSYAPIREQIRETDMVIAVIVVLGAALFYVLQLGIVRSVAEDLRVTEEEADAVNERLHESLLDLEAHSLGTLQALTTTVDAKDSYTAKHSLGVTDYAVAIGRRMGLSTEDLVALEQAGLLHDVGKIGIPEKILLKPGGLDDEEREIVMDHSPMGAVIIESIPFLRKLAPLVRHHHERWDGEGYPDGLSGTEIPRLARILAVSDAFDAMTSDRPYRESLPVTATVAELRRCRGTQFDPDVVDVLLTLLDEGEIVPGFLHTAGRRVARAHAN